MEKVQEREKAIIDIRKTKCIRGEDETISIHLKKTVGWSWSKSWNETVWWRSLQVVLLLANLQGRQAGQQGGSLSCTFAHKPRLPLHTLRVCKYMCLYLSSNGDFRWTLQETSRIQKCVSAFAKCAGGIWRIESCLCCWLPLCIRLLLLLPIRSATFLTWPKRMT